MTLTCSVYGVGLRVNVPLESLQGLEGADRIDVSMEIGGLPPQVQGGAGEPFYETDDVDEHGAPLARITRHHGGAFYRIDYLDGTRVALDAAGARIWAEGPASADEAASYLLGPVLAFALGLRGVTCLHASAVAVDGTAVVFAGISGAGKSSIAAAFARAGFAVLSDDVTPIVRLGSAFCAQPAYPRLRLWPDAVQGLFGGTEALPRISPGWDKRHLDLAAAPYRFQREPLPLAAIYLLEAAAAEGTPRIAAVPPKPALMSLVKSAYATKLMQGRRRADEFETLGRIAQEVPVRSLFRGAGFGCVDATCDLVRRDIARLARP